MIGTKTLMRKERNGWRRERAGKRSNERQKQRLVEESNYNAVAETDRKIGAVQHTIAGVVAW